MKHISIYLFSLFFIKVFVIEIKLWHFPLCLSSLQPLPGNIIQVPPMPHYLNWQLFVFDYYCSVYACICMYVCMYNILSLLLLYMWFQGRPFFTGQPVKGYKRKKSPSVPDKPGKLNTQAFFKGRRCLTYPNPGMLGMDVVHNPEIFCCLVS